jgi:hypothetical protein
MSAYIYLRETTFPGMELLKTDLKDDRLVYLSRAYCTLTYSVCYERMGFGTSHVVHMIDR